MIPSRLFGLECGHSSDGAQDVMQLVPAPDLIWVWFQLEEQAWPWPDQGVSSEPVGVSPAVTITVCCSRSHKSDFSLWAIRSNSAVCVTILAGLQAVWMNLICLRRSHFQRIQVESWYLQHCWLELVDCCPRQSGHVTVWIEISIHSDASIPENSDTKQDFCFFWTFSFFFFTASSIEQLSLFDTTGQFHLPVFAQEVLHLQPVHVRRTHQVSTHQGHPLLQGDKRPVRSEGGSSWSSALVKK